MLKALEIFSVNIKKYKNICFDETDMILLKSKAIKQLTEIKSV